MVEQVIIDYKNRQDSISYKTAGEGTVVNIPSFGTCMQGSPPPTCVHSPIAWQNQSKLIKINGLKCLIKDSTIKCAGGVR